jgi:hypothetical protein
MDKMADLINRHYNATLSELKPPVWERHYPSADDRLSPEARLLFSLCPRCYGRIGDRFASERALVQIIAVHAAVIRYRFLHKRLPATLVELKLGAAATDPFTGAPLNLTSLGGDAYEVSSAGPLNRGHGNAAASAARTPIVVRFQQPE